MLALTIWLPVPSPPHVRTWRNNLGQSRHPPFSKNRVLGWSSLRWVHLKWIKCSLPTDRLLKQTSFFSGLAQQLQTPQPRRRAPLHFATCASGQAPRISNHLMSWSRVSGWSHQNAYQLWGIRSTQKSHKRTNECKQSQRHTTKRHQRIQNSRKPKM